MGHEATGVVEAVGDESRVRPGQAVLLNPIIACETCDACRRGRGNLCANAGLFGREMDGSLAEHVVLPEGYLYPLPAARSARRRDADRDARHRPSRAATRPHRAGRVGRRAGPGCGRAAAHPAGRLAGARPVIAVSRSAWKLELAQRRNADTCRERSPRDVVAAVRDATGGRGADLVIDAAGDPALIAPAIEMLAPGGRLVVYGISHRPVPDFTTFPLYFKELTLYGSRALTPDDFGPAIDLVATGAVDVDGFITASYPLERVAAAFEEYERAAELGLEARHCPAWLTSRSRSTPRAPSTSSAWEARRQRWPDCAGRACRCPTESA